MLGAKVGNNTIIKVIAINLAFLIFAVGAAEMIAMQMEGKDDEENIVITAQDDELGWTAKKNFKFKHKTSEFSVLYWSNELGIHDEPIGDTPDTSKLRILALGDSHTAATGVSTDKTWPNVLERMLFEDVEAGTVYNSGIGGYSVGQELMMARRLIPLVKPQIVILGFSIATDFFDVAPPGRAGFTYGAGIGRVYFDLDPNGKLIEKRDMIGKEVGQATASQTNNITTLSRIKSALGYFALYRLLKRSKMAMWVATNFSFGDESLWPGLDTALKKKPSVDDQFRIDLATQILIQLADEVRAAGAVPVLVQIPYVAQVYDSVWDVSFGSQPDKYIRDGGTQKLSQIAKKAKMHFVDTTQVFIEKGGATDYAYHHKLDAHPNDEGQQVIAETVAASLQSLNLLKPQTPEAPDAQSGPKEQPEAPRPSESGKSE
ncbi:MAG: hypothetical protein CMH56_08000 [Myxococcales bacterium]|nr:hypothetical protein [Myxococcales bacterium]